MIFDFSIILHQTNKKTKTVCDIIFMADEITPIQNRLKEIFKNKISKNSEFPVFSVNLKLWNQYPENVDFAKTKIVNSKSLSEEYKKLIYTNTITPDDFSYIALSELFDFIIEKIQTMDFQIATFVQEILINQIEVNQS